MARSPRKCWPFSEPISKKITPRKHFEISEKKITPRSLFSNIWRRSQNFEPQNVKGGFDSNPAVTKAQNHSARFKNARDLAVGWSHIFFGSCYDVSHEKKTCDIKIPSFGGGQIMVQVAYSSIKKSKIRFEFRRLLDRLGVYERCQITQRERETISLRPAAPPRVNLVTLLNFETGRNRKHRINPVRVM